MPDTPTCWQLLGRVSHRARIFDACLKMPPRGRQRSAQPTLFPDADRYELELPSVLKDVSSVTLLKTDVLFSDTLIGMGQDRIVVDGADGVHEILLAHGTIRARRRWQSLGGARHTVPDMVSVAAVARLRLSSPAAFSVSDTGPVLTDVMGRPTPMSVANTAARVLGLASHTESRAAGMGPIPSCSLTPSPWSASATCAVHQRRAASSPTEVHGAVGIVDGLHAIRSHARHPEPKRTFRKIRVTLTRPNGSLPRHRGLTAGWSCIFAGGQPLGDRCT
jgi:hypothetical protein